MSWAIWITGLPGSGKSVVARAAAARLRAAGQDVTVLELDALRRILTPAPTYSDGEREAVYRALVYIGARLVATGRPVIFDATAHRRAWRGLARATIPRFAEVQLVCPLEVCRQREQARPRGTAPAGIYAHAAQPGARVPGVNVKYELALAPELTIDTAVSSIEAAAEAIVDMVRGRFLLSISPRFGTPEPDAEMPGRQLLLEGGSDEQRVISRRARAWVAREQMVESQIAARGVRDPAVLSTMRTVAREDFVAPELAHHAYADRPLPIGEEQTISQPYVVAAMTEALRLGPRDRVLEIGTGSGYAAAVLAVIAAEVYTIERIKSLAESARGRLAELGYTNVHVRHGDGSLGWPEHAPYDAIVVTAGGPDVPLSLLRQLAVGGRLVMPIGPSPWSQELVRVTRTDAGAYEREELEPVTFVPLIGAEGWSAAEVGA